MDKNMYVYISQELVALGLLLIAILVSLEKETFTKHIHAANGIHNNLFESETTCTSSWSRAKAYI